MAATIQAFSISLGRFNSKFSGEELDARKRAAREEVAILIPASKQLLNSVLREYLMIEDGQIYLSFELTEAQQLSLDFDQPESGTHKSTSGLMALSQDLMRIKESSEFTQIRIGQLLGRLTTQSMQTNHSEDSNGIVGENVEDESSLRKFIYTHDNKTRRIIFEERGIDFQIPLLPKYEIEQGQITRTIQARVKSICYANATITNIKEFNDYNGSATSERLPAKLDIRRSCKQDGIHWKILFAAMETNQPIEAEVRLALHAHNLSPAYFELIEIKNHKFIQSEFDSLDNN